MPAKRKLTKNEKRRLKKKAEAAARRQAVEEADKAGPHTGPPQRDGSAAAGGGGAANGVSEMEQDNVEIEYVAPSLPSEGSGEDEDPAMAQFKEVFAKFAAAGRDASAMPVSGGAEGDEGG